MGPLSASVLVVLALACEDALDLPDQPAVKTERMEVYSLEDAPLCAGTLRAWERHIDAVSRELGDGVAIEPIAVIVTNDSRPYCGEEPVSGCAKIETSQMAAVGKVKSMPHELAHVVKAQLLGGNAIPGLEEGFAEGWSGRGGFLPAHPLGESLGADGWESVDYAAARHFMRWLVRVEGAEAAAGLLRDSTGDDDPGRVFARLEEVFDAPWEEIQREFWRTAPLYDPGPMECDEVAGAVTLTQPLVLELPLACDRADTQGPPPNFRHEGGPSLATARVVEVLEPGSYVAEVDQGRLVMLPCAPVDDALAARFWAAQDRARGEREPLWSYRRRQILNLQEGRYLAWVIAEGDRPVTLAFSLHANRPRSRVALIE